LGQELAAAEAHHRRTKAELQATTAAGNRRPIEARADEEKKAIRQLKARYLAPERFAEHPQSRDEVVRLLNARNDLLLVMLALPRTQSELAADYRRLTRDAAVRQALSDLGGKHRLGPLRDYRSDLRRLAAIDRTLTDPQVPMYRQDNHDRVSVLINDAVPAVMSLRESVDGPTVLAESVADAAGVALDAGAKPVAYTPAAGRKLTARRGVIRTMRIGGVVLRDVPTLVLPPEGEDLGSKLGRAAVSHLRLEPDPARLRLTIAEAR
jgi:hypothetical protein